jgi:protein gp37
VPVALDPRFRGGDGKAKTGTICLIRLERDVPKLLAIPAVAHGVSIEPQLAPVRLGSYAKRLQWVISGGESGAGALISSRMGAFTRRRVRSCCHCDAYAKARLQAIRSRQTAAVA